MAIGFIVLEASLPGGEGSCTTLIFGMLPGEKARLILACSRAV